MHKTFKTSLSLIFLSLLYLILTPSPLRAEAGCHQASCFSPNLIPACDIESNFSPNVAPSAHPALEVVQVANLALQKSTPTPTQLPTTSPTLSPTAAPTPELDPTPIPPEPTPEPTPPGSSSSSLSSDRILELINSHRQTLGLPVYQKDDQLCSIANSRLPDLHNEIFGDSHVHAGFNQLDLDYWITENMVHKPTEEAALNWWLNSSLHRQAIESTSHTHSCGACAGHTCAQLFTSWQPK